MHPGIRPGETPPFHELSEYVFQELCRDLFDTEPSISTCEIYGKRGQSQDGIDLLAHRREGHGIEVGQCKCYAEFTPAQIRRASDEFFDYFSRWSTENVKRFILFVACNLSRRQLQDEIIEQKRRFGAGGIDFEPWSAATIRNKLRPHPGIVATYCKPQNHWVRVICGETIAELSLTGEYPARTSGIVQVALVNQIDRLAERVSGTIKQNLELMHVAWREGRRNEAVKWIKNLKGDGALWRILSPEVKAKVLRFESSLELFTTGDITRTRKLADEAHSLAPSDDETKLRALIAYQEAGPEAALELLKGQEDVDTQNLRAALLLEMGLPEESLAMLNFGDMGLEENDRT